MKDNNIKSGFNNDVVVDLNEEIEDDGCVCFYENDPLSSISLEDYRKAIDLFNRFNSEYYEDQDESVVEPIVSFGQDQDEEWEEMLFNIRNQE